MVNLGKVIIIVLSNSYIIFVHHTTVQEIKIIKSSQTLKSIRLKLTVGDGQPSSLFSGHFITIFTNHVLDCSNSGLAGYQ